MQVIKETFLLAFWIAFNKAITKDNMQAGFRGTSLVLHNLERVLLMLNIVLSTPTPCIFKQRRLLP
jgi:lipopolysaccharide/colanic/teichoic acid biosynthesis glycosyltransferase